MEAQVKQPILPATINFTTKSPYNSEKAKPITKLITTVTTMDQQPSSY